MKPILERYLLTILIAREPKLIKTSCHYYQKTSLVFLFHHASDLSYLPSHPNFSALGLIIQDKIPTYLTRLKTQAMIKKSWWLDKTFFMTHPETLQRIAHIMWYIHKFFLVCLELRKSVSCIPKATHIPLYFSKMPGRCVLYEPIPPHNRGSKFIH